MASVGLAVVLVQRVEQRRVDESPRPNHTGRPDEESPQQAANREANNLRRQHKHDVIAEGQLLVVEDLLCGDDIGCVYEVRANVGHDCNHDVLLDVEWAWVKGPNKTEGAKLGRR